MQLTTILRLASGLAAAALTQATPLTPRLSLLPTAEITFHGAADAQYTLTVPLTGSPIYTYNPLSISSISSPSINIATNCVLSTPDYPPALVAGAPGTWILGPPQTVISLSCSISGGNSRRYLPPPPQPTARILIEFQGADPDQGAFYSVVVPLDGTVVPTNNVLSVSTLVAGFDALATNCVFGYADGEAALARVAVDRWAVGPPQGIVEVSCRA
ncbi:hypothetical protein LZ554_001783 [Drepanopeziza brunnea f. sp. 'monogermtubi']|nr:hypothetical protein LZ554_001783 [Drepanopeziza brunnea f. sp. 'monogermtubi']